MSVEHRDKCIKWVDIDKYQINIALIIVRHCSPLRMDKVSAKKGRGIFAVEIKIGGLKEARNRFAT